MKYAFQIRVSVLFLLLCAGLVRLWGQEAEVYDSAGVVGRQFDEAKRQAYLQDEAYQYDKLKPPVEDPGFWERFLRRFWEFIFKERVGDYSVADMIGYLIGIGALVLIVFGLLKLPIRGVLDRRAIQVEPEFQVEEEALSEMDFEQLIAAALSTGAYQRAVRLLYLETLKDLTLAGRIRWRPDKTNHDYLDELRGDAIHQDFESLTLRYEYACYGDFPVDEVRYREMESIFRHFRENMGVKS